VCLRVVPGQPARMKASLAQRGNQIGVVAVTLDRAGAARQHNPGMPDVGAGKLHHR
jgi:hypothetical protein